MFVYVLHDYCEVWGMWSPIADEAIRTLSLSLSLSLSLLREMTELYRAVTCDLLKRCLSYVYLVPIVYLKVAGSQVYVVFAKHI